ncbi:MAG: YtxH domain-containing protein [Gemmatimonadales bacterium]|jgi:hypothetical protein
MAYAGPARRGKPLSLSPSPQAAESLDPRSRSRQSATSTERGGLTAGVFAAGLTLGIILGAGAALLFAPRSGADTRHALAKRGRRLRRRGRDAWDDLADELRHIRRRRRARHQRSPDEADDMGEAAAS